MSEIEHYESLVDTVVSSLFNDSKAEILEQNLGSLGSLIQFTVINEKIRDELSESDKIWRLIKIGIDSKLRPNNELVIVLRLIRGLILLARNLVIVNTKYIETYNIHHHIFNLFKQLNIIDVNIHIIHNLHISSFQFLANLSINKIEFKHEILHETIDFFQSNEIGDEEQLLFPLLSYLNRMFDNSDLLYEALSKGYGKPIMEKLLLEYEKLDLGGELSQYGLLVVKIFSKLIVNESYLKFITNYNEEEFTTKYLKVAEAIITSKQSWEVFELTVILSWNWELFQRTFLEVQNYFKEKPKEEPKFIYEKISRVMDVISQLAHFEHARKFLLSYKGVEHLVSLLGILHQNVKPLKLKDSEKSKHQQEPGTIQYKVFPGVKSMIIETLSSLAYQNFEVQEKIRELHGLELVLSNCIIDDNEPFIKERSIICLRFLLLENEENQAFVAKLEAKEAISDETLDEAGFEVEIIDGKIKLKVKTKPKV